MALAETFNDTEDFPVFVLHDPVTKLDALEVASDTNVPLADIEKVVKNEDLKIEDQTVSLFALSALTKGVRPADLDTAMALPGRSAQLQRIFELIAFENGTDSQREFDGLTIEYPPELTTVLIEDNIRPSSEVETTEEKHRALSNLRYRVARSLGTRGIDHAREKEIDVDDTILPSELTPSDSISDNVVLASDEYVTNIRRIYKHGGYFKLGLTEENKLAAIVFPAEDGIRVQKEESEECFTDNEEHGLGFRTLKALGKVRRFPTSLDADAWGTWFVPNAEPAAPQLPEATDDMSAADIMAQFDTGDEEW